MIKIIQLEKDVSIHFTSKVAVIHSGKQVVILLPYQAQMIASEISKQYNKGIKEKIRYWLDKII